MPRFRVAVNLSAYFSDHRRQSLLFINETIETISQLQDKIKNLFNISNFDLIKDYHFLPPSEDIHVIKDDDVICVLPQQHGKSVPVPELNHDAAFPDDALDLPTPKTKKRKHNPIEIDKCGDKNIQSIENTKKAKHKDNDLDEIDEIINHERQKRKCKKDKHKDKSESKNKSVNNYEGVSVTNCSGNLKQYQKYVAPVTNTIEYLKQKPFNQVHIQKVQDFAVSQSPLSPPLSGEKGVVEKIVSNFEKKCSPESPKAIARTEKTKVLKEMDETFAIPDHQQVVEEPLVQGPIINGDVDEFKRVMEQSRRLRQETYEKYGITPCRLDPQMLKTISNTRKVRNICSSVGFAVEQLRMNESSVDNSVNMETHSDDSDGRVSDDNQPPSTSVVIDGKNRRRKRKRTRRSKKTVAPINFDLEYVNTNPSPSLSLTPSNSVSSKPTHITFEKDIIEEENKDQNITSTKSEQYIKNLPSMDRISPKAKDIVLFRILKMSEDYTPQISSYVRAKVLDYDVTDDTVMFDILEGLDQCTGPDGKFSLTTEDVEQTAADSIITFKWSDLIDPKLIYP